MELGSYYSFKDIFTSQECERIIKEFSKQQLDKGTMVQSGLNGRKSKMTWIAHTTENDWIYQRIIHFARSINQDKFKVNIDFNCVQDIQFSQYKEGDFYDWHIDLGNTPSTMCRKLSISIQLSDPSKYEGGDLQFGLHENEVQCAMRDRGSGTIFSSVMRHRVSEVKKGTRYSLVVWVTGYPFV